MRIFLIDPENVHHHGLDGIEKLDDTDLVYVLSTPTFKKEKIEGDLLLKVMSSKANFHVDDLTSNGSKNYLDFQLCTILGQLMERYVNAEAVIISKDNGYTAVMDYWKKNNRVINKAESIQDFFTPKPAVVEKAKLDPSDTKGVAQYQKQIATIIQQQFPEKKKGTITKQSKAAANKHTKKELKTYCANSLGDNESNYQLYSRICQIWPY